MEPNFLRDNSSIPKRGLLFPRETWTAEHKNRTARESLGEKITAGNFRFVLFSATCALLSYREYQTANSLSKNQSFSTELTLKRSRDRSLIPVPLPVLYGT